MLKKTVELWDINNKDYEVKVYFYFIFFSDIFTNFKSLVRLFKTKIDFPRFHILKKKNLFFQEKSDKKNTKNSRLISGDLDN